MFEGGHGFLGGAFMWIFWIAIIVVLIVLLRGVMGGGSGSPRSESPMEILRKRYASGEISDEEFERWRKELEK